MRGDSVTATPPPADVTRAGRGSAATPAGTRGAVSTVEVDGTMEEVTITTSLAPVLLTTAGGGGVLRRLPGTTEVLDTTLATAMEVMEEGDVSGTASVPG